MAPGDYMPIAPDETIIDEVGFSPTDHDRQIGLVRAHDADGRHFTLVTSLDHFTDWQAAASAAVAPTELPLSVRIAGWPDEGDQHRWAKLISGLAEELNVDPPHRFNSKHGPDLLTYLLDVGERCERGIGDAVDTVVRNAGGLSSCEIARDVEDHLPKGYIVPTLGGRSQHDHLAGTVQMMIDGCYYDD